MPDGTVSTRVLDDDGFRALVQAVLERHETIGPQVRDASVVLAPLGSVDDLARGVTLRQEPGSVRLEPLPDGDHRRFAWAVGPHSAKAVQHPAEQVLFRARVGADGFTVDGAPDAVEGGAPGRPTAIVGLRPCDLAATAVLDRVLGEASVGGVDPLVVVVNCTDPGGTCFCASMGTGPALDGARAASADLVMWERGGPRGPEYVVTHASGRGGELLAAVPGRPVEHTDLEWAERARQDAVAAMGTTLDTDRLPERLAATLDSSRWDDVARRCLSCGNCTMVCPTCFCSSVHDVSSLDGSEVSRVQRWDTCFSLDHSFIHGGSVRSGTADRYRQWLTHKLSSWWGQFGESGCVGCGRCISWCPVGIDLVEEANALAAEAGSLPAAAEAIGGDDPDAALPGTTGVLLRRRDLAPGPEPEHPAAGGAAGEARR